jgi:putative transposase
MSYNSTESKRSFAASCRLVYNKALALQKDNYDAFINYVTVAANQPLWMRETIFAWPKDSPLQAMQHSLKDLERTYKKIRWTNRLSAL